MRVRLFGLIERALWRLEEGVSALRRHFAVCPDCGRNRYKGAPCVK